jgi:hypothetical protein
MELYVLSALRIRASSVFTTLATNKAERQQERTLVPFKVAPMAGKSHRGIMVLPGTRRLSQNPA